MTFNSYVKSYFHFAAICQESQLYQESPTISTHLLISGLRCDAKTDDTNWTHICSKDNFVADILTKGAGPDKLGEGSVGHASPDWLVVKRSHWPVTEVQKLCISCA